MNITKRKIKNLINEVLTESLGDMLKGKNPEDVVQAIELGTVMAGIEPAGVEIEMYEDNTPGKPYEEPEPRVVVWFDTDDEMNKFADFLESQGFSRNWDAVASSKKGEYTIQTSPWDPQGQKYVILKV